MVSWVASFILSLETEEVEPAISMLMGRAFPGWDQRVLEVSWATLHHTPLNWASECPAWY